MVISRISEGCRGSFCMKLGIFRKKILQPIFCVHGLLLPQPRVEILANTQKNSAGFAVFPVGKRRCFTMVQRKIVYICYGLMYNRQKFRTASAIDFAAAADALCFFEPHNEHPFLRQFLLP